MSERETVEATEIDCIVAGTNALTVEDETKAALVAVLKPIADRIPVYQRDAETVMVRNQSEADFAVERCNAMAEDMKAVKAFPLLRSIRESANSVASAWCGFEKKLLAISDSRHIVRQRVIDWQEDERKKAEAEQRRLQAEADERARKEQAALLKKAEAAKRDTTKERYVEQAQTVVAPTVTVEAPKSGLRGVARVWKIASMDEDAFFAALAQRKDLRGFVSIDKTKTQMERAKAANALMEIPGVVFEQRVR